MAARKSGSPGPEDLQKELEALRAQVTALSQAQPVEADDASSPDSEDDEHIDFEGLLESLKTEIEDLPAMTSLALFTLGILVGRLLSH